MQIGLQSVASYLPPKIIRREDMDYVKPAIPPGMEQMFEGPAERRRMEGEWAVENSAARVGRDAIDKAGLEPGDIDMLISANSITYWDQFFPSMAGWLRGELGLPESAPTFNLQNQCASWVEGLYLAWQMIHAGEAKRVLVSAAMSYTRMSDPTDPLSRMTGDGACAGVVSGQNLLSEFLSYDSLTFGLMHEFLVMKLRYPLHPHLVPESYAGPPMQNWGMASPAGYAWTLQEGEKHGAEGIRRTLAKAGLEMSDVDHVFYHQIGNFAMAWKSGAAKEGLPEENWRDSFDRYGATGNADVGINVADYADNRKFETGDIIVLHGSGGAGMLPVVAMRWLGREPGTERL